MALARRESSPRPESSRLPSGRDMVQEARLKIWLLPDHHRMEPKLGDNRMKNGAIGGQVGGLVRSDCCPVVHEKHSQGLPVELVFWRED